MLRCGTARPSIDYEQLERTILKPDPTTKGGRAAELDVERIVTTAAYEPNCLHGAHLKGRVGAATKHEAYRD